MTTRATTSQSEITEAAKEWTQCLQRFKLAVDSLYNICRETHNFAGCREVLLYLGNATHAFESLIVMIDVEQNWEKDPLCKTQSVAWEIKATTNKPTMQEEIWQVVQSRRRRNTFSSDDSGEEPNRSEKEKKTNVYERLAYGIRRPIRPFSPEVTDPDAITGCNLMAPRSAFDLPQTKASMAKMAYSRERLWKKNKPLLEEKLSTLQRRQAVPSPSNRRSYSQVAKTPPKQKSDADRSREPSLASISETAEEDDNLSTVTMAERAGLDTEKLLAELGGDDKWLQMTAEEISLGQEEESLQKQILEEEQSSIDDEFELEANRQFGKTGIRYKKSWKEVISNWTQLNEKAPSEPLCYRKPGEAAQMHEKLSSPSRRRTKTDFEKRLEERQQRAFELRQQLLEDKAHRLKELHAKVDEIKQKRIEVEEKKRALLEDKMEKAHEKREKNLAEVVKRGRDDDLRIHEIKLIQTLEDMSRKNEIQSKEEERQEKLRQIAMKQAKKAEENAAKHAQVEENRKEKMQRDAEKLLEQTEKTEARLQNAAANRIELLEEMRKKQRKHTEKVDRLKVNESQASQSLLDRMQNKFEKAEKLHEETIGMVKQRAAELSSPRPQSSAMILSDCLQLPSEQTDDGWKKCTVCKVKINSPLHALAHVCTTEHLANRKCDKSELNFEEVKQELETFIISCPEIEGAADLTDPLSDSHALSSDNNNAKKKRSKLKQRLIKDNEPLSLIPTAAIEKGLYRIIKELEVHVLAACRSSTLSEANRSQIEKYLLQFDKQINEIRDERDRDNNLSRIIPSTTITESMLKLLTIPDFYDQNRPAKRLYLKICAFFSTLFSPTKVSEAIFKTKYLTDVAELLIQTMKLFSNHADYEQAISTLYILYQIGLSLPKDASLKLKQRLNVLATFLISHGFIYFAQSVLISISKGSMGDKIELSPMNSIGVIETISGFINLVARQIPESQEIQESFYQLFECYFVVAVNYLFNAIPRDSPPMSPTPPRKNEGMIARNFFVAFARDIIRLTPDPKTLNFIKRVLLKDDSQNALRIVFILNSVIQKRIPKFENLSPMAIRVCAHLASIDVTIQRFCLLGWQHSLLLALCRHSFDLLAPHEARYSVLIAIFSIVRKSKVAIEAMETEIGVSWLAIFLEHLLKNQIKESPETLSILPVPIREEYYKFYHDLL